MAGPSARTCRPASFLDLSRIQHTLHTPTTQLRRPLPSRAGISGFPTVHFWLRKDKVTEVVGYDPAGIERAIVEWKAKAAPTFGGAGLKLGGATASE